MSLFEKKVNMVCPLFKCNYTAKVFAGTFKRKKEYNESRYCPIHRLELISFGSRRKLPKNNKKKKYFKNAG